MVLPSPHGITALAFIWQESRNQICLNATPKGSWIDEFFFCILGGYGVSYELNKSAFEVLKSKGYFIPDLYEKDTNCLQLLLEEELRSPQFGPIRKNGSHRRFRFHRAKSKSISEAGSWLFERCRFSIDELLLPEPRLSRQQFLECPGMGYKTASWFLRNIGFGNGLAILDVHLLRVLTEFQIIPYAYSLPQDYLKIEDIFLRVCDSIGARVELFDLILWSWERGKGQRWNQNQTSI